MQDSKDMRGLPIFDPDAGLKMYEGLPIF